ncbi:hypothetical protein LSTR_LSTR015513, partial [Laodelphax striatellus]
FVRNDCKGIQILSQKCHAAFKKKEEPAQGEVDQGLPENGGQRAGHRSGVRVRKGATSAEVRPRVVQKTVEAMKRSRASRQRRQGCM